MVLLDVPNQRPVDVSSSGVAISRAGALNEYLHDQGSVGLRRGTLSPGSRPQVLVELASGSILPLDRDFAAPKAAVGFATDRRQGAEGKNDKIGVLQDWVLVDGNVVGYADIEGPGSTIFRWKNGFVRFPLSDSASFQDFRTQTHPDPLRAYFRLSYPFLAGLQGTAYAILLDSHMGLWKLGPDDQDLVRMQAFPKHLQNRLAPNLWDWAHPDEFPRLMQEVERSTMPTGLYAWGNALFIVSRAFENGHQVWQLSKIDPVEDELLWTVPIKSRAHHLTVIPGPKEWAFLEKGPVVELFSQRTDHILFVDSARMLEPKLQSLCN